LMVFHVLPFFFSYSSTQSSSALPFMCHFHASSSLLDHTIQCCCHYHCGHLVQHFLAHHLSSDLVIFAFILRGIYAKKSFKNSVLRAAVMFTDLLSDLIIYSNTIFNIP
jgi:hypothetical protein